MIIAHDLGTTGNKATLVDDTGRLRAAVTVAYGTEFGPGGKAEQDATAWWRAVAEATRRLLERVPGAAQRVDVVSFSGQMMGAVFLDEKAEPVRPAIIWADTRSTRQTQQLIDRIGMERAYRILGHRLNPTYSLEKVMWVRDNEPDSFRRTRHIVCAKDYAAYRLTGRLHTDPSDASSTNAYDQSAGTWSEEILAAAGIPATLLAEIVPSQTVIGAVTPEAAAETGLRSGTAVVIGGGDGPMAALGAGIVGPDSGAYTYLGSSSWVSRAADEPLLDPQMRSMTFNHVVPGRFVPTATMQAGGASLQWIVEVLQPEAQDYDALLAEAAEVEAARDGLYFLPHLLGERSPYWNPLARAVFAGLARHHDRRHLVRAVLEGVAFNLNTGLLAVAAGGAPIDSIRAIGGGAGSDLFLQVLSDVWGRPVRRRALAEEATALGAAIVGGVGVGLFDDYGIAASLSDDTGSFEPDADGHRSYARAYELFMDAYRRLEPWFERL
ncbi:MAG: xylulokinase [Micrococcales bacterium 73-13]|nr:MAG: xylulokinase [Micrococcales bacterium 73-13]